MKKLLPLLLVVLVGGLIPLSVTYAQTTSVTFVLNTSTVPDTLTPISSIVVIGAGDSLTNWSTGRPMTNISGDYWSGTVKIPTGDTLQYKFRIGSGGWEENINGPLGDHTTRNVVVGAADTVLPVAYWNNGHFASGKNPGQFDAPWPVAVDTFFNVYFRVDMQGVSDAGSFNFDKTKDTVAVRGGGNSDLTWGANLWLTRESSPTSSAGAFAVDPTNFWSGRARISKNQVHPGDTLQYKFLIGYTWGRDEQLASNRIFVVPSQYKDTTLYYSYYNNQKPIVRSNADTVVVTYLVDMKSAIQNRGFAVGDTLQVTSGYFVTAQAQSTSTLNRVGLSTKYTVTDTIITSLSKTLDYQFYVVKNATSYREVYYNFNYAGGTASEAERRQVIISSKTQTIPDTVSSISSSRRQPSFQNITPVAQNLTVTFTVDVRPAIYAVKAGKTLTDGQGPWTVTNVDSIFKWGIAINGPATDTTNGWASWGASLINDTTHRMYDDGTHGDAVAHDSIFTRIYTYRAGKDIVGQEYKFGIGGGDNEGGYGNNHIQNLDDSQPTSVLASQFGSIDPIFYSAWNYDCGCPASPNAVNEPKNKPAAFALHQNYPNPFNPSTKIDYNIPADAVVMLKVYNILGQEIATVVNEKQFAGSHSAIFDASRLTSGVYFYKISAGTYTSTKKMLLIK